MRSAKAFRELSLDEPTWFLGPAVDEAAVDTAATHVESVETTYTDSMLVWAFASIQAVLSIPFTLREATLLKIKFPGRITV